MSHTSLLWNCCATNQARSTEFCSEVYPDAFAELMTSVISITTPLTRGAGVKAHSSKLTSCFRPSILKENNRKRHCPQFKDKLCKQAIHTLTPHGHHSKSSCSLFSAHHITLNCAINNQFSATLAQRLDK